MNTNESDIKSMVDRARQLAADQQQAKQAASQQVTDLVDRRKSSAEALRTQIEAKFKAVAAASDGAMAYNGPTTAGVGAADYQLMWIDPPPNRGLSIVVSYLEGTVAWGWITAASAPRMNSADVLTFGQRHLDQLIRGLGDQESWSKGQTPSVRL
jgi:hypothetical protein